MDSPNLRPLVCVLTRRTGRGIMRPNFWGKAALALAVVFSIGCGGPKTTPPDYPGAAAARRAGLAVAVAPAQNLPGEASVRVTGSYVAKETSDVAPAIA